MSDYSLEFVHKKGIEAFNLLFNRLALIKSFCRGSRGAVFSKSAPLAAGGKKG
jgi:hypothetical protein